VTCGGAWCRRLGNLVSPSYFVGQVADIG
jgi:hypothetical protein